MITAAELRKKAENLYKPVLRALLLGDDPFPLPVRYGRLRLTAPMAELRQAIEVIRSQGREVLGHGYTVEWKTVETRRYGRNSVPGHLSFATASDLFRYLGREAEAKRIRENARRLSAEWPAARAWAASHIRYLVYEPEFFDFAIRILRYLCEHPFPNLFARQLPVEVPTKFIEENAALLQSLAEVVIPGSLRDEGDSLEERLGLKTPASLIEVRLLDPTVAPGIPFSHFTAAPEELEADRFDRLETVLIVENGITFLTLPFLPRTLAIMGQGYGIHRLKRLPWLAGKRLLYWGDLDVQGFEILAGLRSLFGHVESVFMDRDCLERYSAFAVAGSGKETLSPLRRPHLSLEEQSLADELASRNRRLEQEKIPQGDVVRVLELICARGRLRPSGAGA